MNHKVAPLVFCAAFVGMGCGKTESASVVYVTVTAPAGLRPVTKLRVNLTYAGRSDTELFPNTNSTTAISFVPAATFVLDLPHSSTGSIDIAIDALDSLGNLVSHGENTAPIVAGGRTDVTVVLGPGNDGDGGVLASDASGADGTGGTTGTGGITGIGGTTSTGGTARTGTGGATGTGGNINSRSDASLSDAADAQQDVAIVGADGSAGGVGGTTAPPATKDAAPSNVCDPATPPSSGPKHQVIMVVKSIASPGIAPTLLKTHLEARGFKVDYAFIYTSSTKTDAGSIPNLWFLDDAKTKVVDFSQYGLAVVTKDGYTSGANLDNIPVLCGNNQTSDSALAMATTDGNTSSTKGAFTLIDPKHPIAAMKTGDSLGTVLLETGSSPVLKVMLAVVPATAHVVGVDWGTAAPGTSAAALFAYDVGDALVAGTAKARRVGFFLDDSTSWSAVVAGSMTWQFFDAAVDWLVGLTPCSGDI